MMYAEFIQLDEMDQYLLMVKKGVQVARRKDNFYRYFLYQLDTFYVEVKLHLRQAVLQGLIASTATLLLEQYLDKININSAIGFFD